MKRSSAYGREPAPGIAYGDAEILQTLGSDLTPVSPTNSVSWESGASQSRHKWIWFCSTADLLKAKKKGAFCVKSAVIDPMLCRTAFAFEILVLFNKVI
jgi:hypothetical protein